MSFFLISLVHVGSKDDKQLSFHDFHETFEFCEIFNKNRPSIWSEHTLIPNALS